MSRRHDVKNAAERARDAGREVADLVYEKQMAYGDSASIQRGLWGVLLDQYRWPTARLNEDRPGEMYEIPVELMDHVPRLTRVFDRIARIVSNPRSDRLGEDPWRDLCGDAMVGIIMPRTGPLCGVSHPVTGHGCERRAGHDDDVHRYAHAGGVVAWTYNEVADELEAEEEAEEEWGEPGDRTGVGHEVRIDTGSGLASEVREPPRNEEGGRACAACQQYFSAEAFPDGGELCARCKRLRDGHEATAAAGRE